VLIRRKSLPNFSFLEGKKSQNGVHFAKCRGPSEKHVKVLPPSGIFKIAIVSIKKGPGQSKLQAYLVVCGRKVKIPASCTNRPQDVVVGADDQKWRAGTGQWRQR